ncbi:MAG: glycosyl hydrolase family 28-related protein [Kiritimatiellae bacterium]|jgi:hypothetical protein|nr:glycosyl hydrolase family 28-related protein [Kiritimatiellia bacterium]
MKKIYIKIIIAICTAVLIETAVAENKIFPADAVINVTLPPYSAKPDDGVDDTSAIQKPISENIENGRTLYFPDGTYNISNTLTETNSAGLWRAHMTIQGQNKE